MLVKKNISVDFQPVSAGMKSATLVITLVGFLPVTINLAGTAL